MTKISLITKMWNKNSQDINLVVQVKLQTKSMIQVLPYDISSVT